MVSIPVGEDFALEAVAQVRVDQPAVVLCHPHPAFGGRMSTPLVVALAETLERFGLSTVRFNFRGLEGSGGQATGGHLEHEDVCAVVDWTRSQGAPRIAVVGYSFGALMACRAMARGLVVEAYAAVGFPTSLVADVPERVADCDRAFDRGVPSLFVHGDRDPFCDALVVRSWADERPQLRIQLLTGEGHFFDGTTERAVVDRVVHFCKEVLC